MVKVAADITSVREVLPDMVKYFIYFINCFALKYSYKSQMSKNYSLTERIVIYTLLDLCLISSGIGLLISALKPISDVNELIIWIIGIFYGGFHVYLCIASDIALWIDDSCFWDRIFGLYYVLRLKEYSFQDLLLLRGMVLNFFKSIDNDEFTLFAETNSVPIFTSNKV